ncbi:MAG: iron reductase [Lactobacillus sp.]|jgi:predicted ferric reductase|nr:iron reductase [Lactobacillus sp.]
MLKTYRYTLSLVWLVVWFLVPLPFIQTLTTGLPALYNAQRLAIIWGAVAYAWMLASIYLSTRPHWLDRLIGLPKMYMIHGIMALAAVALAYFHKQGSPSAGWIKTTGDWAFDLFLGLLIFALVFMAGWFTSHVKVIQVIKRWLETHLLQHELTMWLHRLNSVAVALVFIHVQLIGYIRAITPFMIWFDGATLLVALSYLWQKWRSQRTVQLQRTQLIAPNVLELTLSIPQKLIQQYLPGDFLFLAIPQQAGLQEPHPFSITKLDMKRRQLTLTIRGDGDFTRQLQSLKTPIAVTITTGFGQYEQLLTRRQPQQLLLIGGGMGVVPLLAVVQQHPELTTDFFYSAHSQADLLYPQAFATWQQRPNFNGHLQVGRFEADTILQALPQNLENLAVMIGGPQALGQYWRARLQQHGLSPDQIYYEEFSW